MDELIYDRNINKEEIVAEIIEIRRDIHAHPEIGFKETRTSQLVINKLNELGIEVKKNIAHTGVVGILRGNYPGKTILLRADMDALKMTELNDVEYKSKYEGIMHGCGHDAHTAWLLGAAMILTDLKDKIHGTVKFLFQPAEETDGGAELMIKEGVLDDPKVDAVIGAHVCPVIKTGKIGIKYGSMMAATDDFNLTICGKGGHSSQLNHCIDPIRIGNQVYLALQNIVYSKIDALEPFVLAVTKFNAGNTNNVIPNKIELGGSVRTTTYETNNKIPKIMESIIKGIVESNGATYNLEYKPFCLPLVNNDEITAFVEKVGKEMLGEKNVEIVSNTVMGGDDFSYFSKSVPGTYFLVGTLNSDKGIINEPHNPYFNIDEDILYQTSKMFANLVLKYLNGAK